jgi:hypothetical protein
VYYDADEQPNDHADDNADYNPHNGRNHHPNDNTHYDSITCNHDRDNCGSLTGSDWLGSCSPTCST